MRLAVTIGVLAAILLLAGGVGWAAWAAWRDARPSPSGPVRERHLVSPTIIITKAERKLRLFSGERLVATCRIGLGANPIGHKQQEGDGRTPEGRYTICMKNPRSKFFLSLGLSYPGKADAERGRTSGLISPEQHDAIVAAIEAGRQPPWNTPLGGEVFIHGSGSSSDWTRGCVALDDADMKDLYEQIELGTPVEIRP